METPRPLPKADFEVETLTMVVLSEGPRASEYSGATLERLLQEHLAFTVGLVAEGHLLSAGGVVDSDRSSCRLTGIGLSTKSPDEVRRLVEQDPSVKAGLESVKTVTYTFPKGMLAFPLAKQSSAPVMERA
ncbi:MAG TPA: YciI family protein [Candidatus Dormibacteraeota bacterium]